MTSSSEGLQPTLKKSKEQPKWFFYVLLLALTFEYLRPQDSYLAFLAPLRIPAMLLLTLTYIFFSNQKDYLKGEPIYVQILLFWLLISASILWSTNHNSTYEASMQVFWMMLGFVFPAALIVNELEKLKTLLWVWLVIHFFLSIIVISNGGTGPGGILYDENDVALCLVMAVPFFFYLSYYQGFNKKRRFFALLGSLVAIGAILISASRGGVVALVAAIGISLLLSKRTIRNGLLLLAAIGVFGGIFLSFFSEAYIADMMNMTNPEDSTRDERIYTWSIGWVMFLDNPIFGVSAGNFNWTNHLYYKMSPMWEEGRVFLGGRAAHSVYFTLIPELGLSGCILFYLMAKSFFKRCFQIKSLIPGMSEENQELYTLLFKAFLCSMTGYLIGGIFISVLYYPFFWYLIAFAIISFNIAKKISTNTDATSNQFKIKQS